MSIKVMTWVFDHSPAEKLNRLVLLKLADVAHDDGTSAYPSPALLAEKCRCSKRAAGYALNQLEAAGCIVQTGRVGRAREWQVLMTEEAANAVFAKHPTAKPRDDVDDDDDAELAPKRLGAESAPSQSADTASPERRNEHAKVQNLRPESAETASREKDPSGNRPGTVLNPPQVPSLREGALGGEGATGSDLVPLHPASPSAGRAITVPRGAGPRTVSRLTRTARRLGVDLEYE